MMVFLSLSLLSFWRELLIFIAVEPIPWLPKAHFLVLHVWSAHYNKRYCFSFSIIKPLQSSRSVKDSRLLHWFELGQLISSLLYCNPQYPFIMAADDRRRDRSRSRERDAPSGFGAQQSMYPMHGNRPPAMPYGYIPNLPTLPAFATAPVSRVKSSTKR